VTSREKIAAAFSADGAAESPVGICYENIFFRDHWEQLTSCPWWYSCAPDISLQMAWRKDAFSFLSQDWMLLPEFFSREERQRISLEVAADAVRRRDAVTGEETTIRRAPKGGSPPKIPRPEKLAQATDEIESLVASLAWDDPDRATADGRDDLARRLREEFPRAGYRFLTPPLSATVCLWGYEGMMTMMADRPDLVRHACRLLLDRCVRSVRASAALGADIIWVEEAFLDAISPEMYRTMNLPFLRPLFEEIRSLGLMSIFYFGGNPAGKVDILLDSGADCLAFEESKKGFSIDIAEMAQRVRGRCALLGNLDAIHLLPRASEEQLRAEIARQIAAGRRNRNRFVMCIGSPVTPATSARRVRQFIEMSREMASKR